MRISGIWIIGSLKNCNKIKKILFQLEVSLVCERDFL